MSSVEHFKTPIEYIGYPSESSILLQGDIALIEVSLQHACFDNFELTFQSLPPPRPSVVKVFIPSSALSGICVIRAASTVSFMPYCPRARVKLSCWVASFEAADGNVVGSVLTGSLIENLTSFRASASGIWSNRCRFRVKRCCPALKGSRGLWVGQGEGQPRAIARE